MVILWRRLIDCSSWEAASRTFLLLLLVLLAFLILHGLAKLALLVVRCEALIARVFPGKNPLLRFVFKAAHGVTTSVDC